MDKKTGLILGSVFIITSGLIYTIERLSAYIYWLAEVNTGDGYGISPEPVPLFDNPFTVLFFVVGFVLIILPFRKNVSFLKE